MGGGGAEGCGAKVAHETPPERVRRALVRERVRLAESPLDEPFDVDVCRLEGSEALGESCEPAVGLDVVGKPVDQGLVGPAGAGDLPDALVEGALVRRRRPSGLERAGDATLVVWHREGGAPHRQVRAEARVLACREGTSPGGGVCRCPGGGFVADLPGEPRNPRGPATKVGTPGRVVHKPPRYGVEPRQGSVVGGPAEPPVQDRRAVL